MNPPCNKTKVVHVITRFDKGGSAENTFLTVRNLDEGRYRVLLVKGPSPAGTLEEPEVLATQANIEALRAQQVEVVTIGRLVRNLSPLSDLLAFFMLLRVIRRERPDIVHTHTSKAGILGRWAAWFCRCPVIVHTPHGHVFWGYFGPLKTRLFIWTEKATAWFTDAIITLTQQERADHLHLQIAPEEKFAVIHSGVDVGTFLAGRFQPAETKAALGIPPEMTVVGTVGRLTAVKGQEVLLKAVSELIRHGEKIFLVLLGEGELRGALEQLALDLGIAENVRFLGWRPDVARVMSAYDIFCLPSLNEGMGKVLVEAMTLGLPMIASNIGGIKDLVRPGENGLLVPAGDVIALAEAIACLCRDPERRRQMGDAGRQMAPLYSSEEMIKKIDQLYRKLVKESKVI